MQSQEQKYIEEVLKERKEQSEANFKAEVKNKISQIAELQKIIRKKQTELAEVQKSLRELKVEHEEVDLG